jgi:hypothetical protein
MADSGVLVCKGVNGFGSVSVQMNLIVKGKEGKGFLKKKPKLMIRVSEANWTPPTIYFAFNPSRMSSICYCFAQSDPIVVPFITIINTNCRHFIVQPSLTIIRTNFSGLEENFCRSLSKNGRINKKNLPTRLKSNKKFIFCQFST